MPKDQPFRIISDGVEYFSVSAAARAIGRSVRTVKRLEARGHLPRPEHVLAGGNANTRWYSASDLELLRRAAAESGFGDKPNRGQEFVASLAERKREREQAPEERAEEKTATPWAGFMDGMTSLKREEAASQVRRWAVMSGEEPTTPRAPAAPAPTCPCGRELLWKLEKVPNGHRDFLPTCEVHGVVNLAEPQPVDENVCAGCGGELTYELQPDEDGRLGFVPTCPACGPVEVKAKKKEPSAEGMRFADFAGLPPTEGRRRRGRLVAVGAIRAPKTKPGPGAGYLDPRD